MVLFLSDTRLRKKAGNLSANLIFIASIFCSGMSYQVHKELSVKLVLEVPFCFFKYILYGMKRRRKSSAKNEVKYNIPYSVYFIHMLKDRSGRIMR